MQEPKRKRGRKPKKQQAETIEVTVDDVVSPTTADTADTEASPSRRSQGRPRKIGKHAKSWDISIIASPVRRSSRFSNGDCGPVLSNGVGDRHVSVVAEPAPPPVRLETVARVVPSMDAVVKVFCVHTDPNFSLPWQRKRQYSSSSSGFIIGERRVLTNAHSVEHHTQVKLKKRGSDIKYLATVLSIGTECDIGTYFLFFDLLSFNFSNIAELQGGYLFADYQQLFSGEKWLEYTHMWELFAYKSFMKL